MEISELHLKDSSAGVDYLNIGMTFKSLKRYPEAIEALRTAREIFKEAKDSYYIVTCDEELTEVYIALGNPVEIQYYAQRALDFYTLLQNHRHTWWLKYYIGIAHRLLGEDDEAIELFEDAKSLALAMGYQEWEFLIKVEKEMAEMFIVRGRVHEANEIFRRIKSVEDIVRSETVHEAA
jgi:tetratricopeptide (TPR) repeat protein